MSGCPEVLLCTPHGDLRVRVRTDRAPLSAGSFLAHLDRGLYQGATFYRAAREDNELMPRMPAELIQGGRGFNGGSPLPPVAHEPSSLTGLQPLCGTIALARDAPGTACSEFFINMADNIALAEGGARAGPEGVAVFGEVVAGMEVALTIQASACGRSDPNVPALVYPQMLLEPVRILSARRSGITGK